MQIVRAGLDANVHDRTGLPAVFRSGIFLGLEFVDGIDRHDRSGIARGHYSVKYALAHPGVAGHNAVDHVNVIVGALPIGTLRPA